LGKQELDTFEKPELVLWAELTVVTLLGAVRKVDDTPFFKQDALVVSASLKESNIVELEASCVIDPL